MLVDREVSYQCVIAFDRHGCTGRVRVTNLARICSRAGPIQEVVVSVGCRNNRRGHVGIPGRGAKLDLPEAGS